METPAKNKLDRLAAALTLTYAHNSLTSLKCKHRIWDLLLLTEPSRPLTPQFNSNKIPSSLPPCCFLLLLPSPPSSCPITFHSLATFLLIFSYLWSPMLLFCLFLPCICPLRIHPMRQVSSLVTRLKCALSQHDCFMNMNEWATPSSVTAHVWLLLKTNELVKIISQT